MERRGGNHHIRLKHLRLQGLIDAFVERGAHHPPSELSEYSVLEEVIVREGVRRKEVTLHEAPAAA